MNKNVEKYLGKIAEEKIAEKKYIEMENGRSAQSYSELCAEVERYIRRENGGMATSGEDFEAARIQRTLEAGKEACARRYIERCNGRVMPQNYSELCGDDFMKFRMEKQDGKDC